MKKFITIIVLAIVFISITFGVGKYIDEKVGEAEANYKVEVQEALEAKSSIELIEIQINSAILESNDHKESMERNRVEAEAALQQAEMYKDAYQRSIWEKRCWESNLIAHVNDEEQDECLVDTLERFASYNLGK